MNAIRLATVTAMMCLVFASVPLAWGHGTLSGKTEKVNGVDIYYESEGQGPAIFLMHGGLGLDHWVFHWPESVSPLKDSFQLVYYDHRANGRSGGDPATITFDNLTKDAEDLRLALGFEKIILIGWSYGGFVALDYALRYPESVAALVLYGTYCRPESLVQPKGKVPPGAETRESMWGFFFYSEERLKQYDASDETLLKIEANEAGNIAAEKFDVCGRLGEIQVPTLVLAGEWDFLWSVEEQQRPMANAIPHATLTVIPEAGHYVSVEQPRLFQQAIRDFLRLTTPVQPSGNAVMTWARLKDFSDMR